jgi:hypothetical protein
MYKLDKRPSCDKVDAQTWQPPIMWQVDVQTWQTPIMWQGRCTNLTNTHHVTMMDDCKVCTYTCHIMGVCQVCSSTLSHDGCLSSLYIYLVTWRVLSSLCIYLVTWWAFVKFVHLPCHMMGVCQVCTSTLSHDGRLSSLYIYLVTRGTNLTKPFMWQGRCTNLTNTHHVTR